MAITRAFGVIVGGVLFAMGLALAACGSTVASPTGPAQPAKPPNCDFEILTVAPAGGFSEIGVIDVSSGAYGSHIYTELLDFKQEIQPHVCKIGGDAAIAHVNGLGYYIKATILSRSGAAPAPTTAAPAAAAPSGSSGCQFDTQCKGDRICVEARCVDPAPQGGSATRTP